MKTFKNFMVEGPSDLAPNPGIVKAIKKDKEEAKRRKQEMIATREKNLKNYQQGKVRANWVKEEVDQIDELSKFTLHSYAHKAKQAVQSANYVKNNAKKLIPMMAKPWRPTTTRGKTLKPTVPSIKKYYTHLEKVRQKGLDLANRKISENREEVDQIDEVAAWQRSEGKNPEGGLNRKGVESYRRSHPGSKLSTAVTTDPSKLKPGSKKAKRRLSFCRRMKGMKNKLTSAKTAHDPDSRINKSLRKWNC